MMVRERTSAYRFTIKSKDDPRLAVLRKEVAEANAQIPWEPGSSRDGDFKFIGVVSIKGRLGKDNPHAAAVSAHAKKDGSIPHWAAGHFDVYVHSRFVQKRPKAPAPPEKQPPMNVDRFYNFIMNGPPPLGRNMLATYTIDGMWVEACYRQLQVVVDGFHRPTEYKVRIGIHSLTFKTENLREAIAIYLTENLSEAIAAYLA